MSAKGGKAPTTKMKEVKSMAKKIGIIVLLCFSLCVGGVSAFANEGHDETDTQTLIETQPPVSSVLFRQDGADIQQSTDEGKTWQSYSPIEETDYFTYDEFSAWIENETENIQKLVDAGEWTEAEATEALEYYDEILKSILEGKMVGKRASSSDDQLFFSMPDNAQPEQYQTFVFDGNTYKSIGPFDTEEELPVQTGGTAVLTDDTYTAAVAPTHRSTVANILIYIAIALATAAVIALVGEIIKSRKAKREEAREKQRQEEEQEIEDYDE